MTLYDRVAEGDQLSRVALDHLHVVLLVGQRHLGRPAARDARVGLLSGKPFGLPRVGQARRPIHLHRGAFTSDRQPLSEAGGERRQLEPRDDARLVLDGERKHVVIALAALEARDPDRFTGEPPDRVERVDAHVGQVQSQPGDRKTRIRQLDRGDLAELRRRDQLSGKPVGARATLVEADHQLPIRGARRLAQPDRVLERFALRFLDEHVPSRAERGDPGVDVQCRRADDDDGVEVRAREQLVE